MLTVYPSNRLEYLTTLLFEVMKTQQGSALTPADILKPKKVIVESHGVRHWIQLRLAETQGIAMNLKFQMPSAFIWDLCREILGDDAIPETSTYSEAVLRWRIDEVLACSAFKEHPAAASVNQYWQENGVINNLKRYQLASRLASLFEQYIKFRPDWVEAWSKGELLGLTLDNKGDGTGINDEAWQAHLWRLLNAQPLEQGTNVHPITLQQQALSALSKHRDLLPRHIYLFGINSLPRPSLEFIQALSKYTHVHLFHLNPCVEFWGDIRSDKSKAKALRQTQWHAWMDADEAQDTVNPLLANLGQQGKSFFNALQSSDHFEISAFDRLITEYQDGKASNRQQTLQGIQQDILTLRNATLDETKPVDEESLQDASLAIRSSHSCLREIQTLHDYLLHQFNQDRTLKPKDVLVMCPDIELYAPYIDAVFRRPWHGIDEDESPRLPCSIADRVTLEKEPLIGAFIDLLTLPDSRFEVSKILDFLRVPALQNCFGFSNSELETIEWWLEEACVHWGVNRQHKARIAELSQSTPMYTWYWGLERLLLGFAQGDEQTLHGESLLLPHVEGQDAVLLGRLFQLLDRLKFHARELLQSRTASEWQVYLKSLKESVFQPTEEEFAADQIIEEAINQFADYTQLACYPEKISFPVMQSYLNHQFSQPDTGNHFMTGQVTFCSMVPMRSIPFRVIAVLGLNDGDFPRQDQSVSFDLLRKDGFRAGDRSRRADDRYIFLETLISARDKLYLSYQGRDIRNNEERQPSLVLKELMSYLEKGYGWKPNRTYVDQSPLQPFSEKNYLTTQASFDSKWCRLAYPMAGRDNHIRLKAMAREDNILDVDTLVRFFDDPLRWFAQQRLNLYLEPEESLLEDVEPFDVDPLTSYQIRAELIDCRLTDTSSSLVVDSAKLSGRLPESPVTNQRLEEYEEQAESFQKMVSSLGEITKETVVLNIAGLEIHADIPWIEPGKKLLLYRPAKRKAKDEFRLWLLHLIASIYCQDDGEAEIESLGVFFGKASYDTVSRCKLSQAHDAQALLANIVSIWKESGSRQPSVLHAVLGADCEEASMEDFQASVYDTLKSSVYFQWFFEGDESQEHRVLERDFELLKQVFSPLYQNLTNVKGK